MTRVMATSKADPLTPKHSSDLGENICRLDTIIQSLSDYDTQIKTHLIKQPSPEYEQSLCLQPQNLDDVLSNFKLGMFHWRMLALVGGGYFAACSEMMLFVFLSTPLKEEWNLGEFNFSWLPFSTGIAGIVGGYLAGTVSDIFGRRLPFLIGIIIIAVSGLASAFASSFVVFIAFRCMVTVGIGTFEAVGFVLLLEFLPKEGRGPIMVVITLCGALGAVLVGGFAWLILPNFGWRWFVGAGAAPAFLLLCYQPFVFFESPRYLITCGRDLEAANILKKMARVNKCELPDLDNLICLPSKTPKGQLINLFSMMCPAFKNLKGCSPSEKPRGQLINLFRGKFLLRTLTFSAIWFLQAAGYWGVTIYLPEYMAKLGAEPYFNMFSVFIGEIPGLFLAMLLIEHYMLGRIRTLRFFSGMTALSLFVFSFIPEHAFKSALIVLCYFSMVPIYSVLNTVTPELYPTEFRSTAMAWVNTLIELPGLVTPFIGETLLSSHLPWLYPVVWGSVFVFQFAITFTLRNETAGKEIETCRSEITESEGSETETTVTF